MKLYNAIMEMPVKKVAVIAICTFLVLMFMAQSLFVNQVFSIINRSITNFENIAKDDDNEFNKDMREFDEHRAYDAQMSAHNSDRLNLSILASPQEKGCFHEKTVKRFETMQSMAYVKHSEAARSNVEFELKESRDAIKTAIAKHEFNPSLCNQVTS